jgi:lysophospholipase L1-like esterase
MSPSRPRPLPFLAAAATAVSAAAAAAQGAFRIMPLGDSITEWQCNNESQGGWRNYLGNTLISAYFPTWSFVGPRYGCGNHAGYSGWTAAQLMDIVPSAMAAYQPDMVLLQIGTNDLFFNQPGFTQGADVNGTYARIETLVNTTFSILPNTAFLVSGPTPINATRCANYSSAPWHPANCPPLMQPWIEELNGILPNLVTKWGKGDGGRGYNISFADPAAHINFVAEDYWIWGIHFNETGYQKIAAFRWEMIKNATGRG